MSLERFKKELMSSYIYYDDLRKNNTLKTSDSTKETIFDPENVLIENLIEALEYIRCGAVSNPNLVFDLINPENAECGIIENISFIDKNVDDSQGLAVRKALKMNNLLVIQGPPGAGKSTTVVEIIRQLKTKNPKAKFLITSQSHVAVDAVLEKLVKNDFTNIIRLAAKNEENDKLKPYYFKTILENYLSSINQNDKKLFEKYVINSSGKNNQENILFKHHIDKIWLSRDVIGITSNSIKKANLPLDSIIDYTIVDEVGKMTFAELMYVVRFSNKLIIIGDPKQLPAVIKDFKKGDTYDEENFNYVKNSNFVEYLFETVNLKCKVFLNKQYRMSKQIGNYISDCFYNFGENKLQNGVSTTDSPNSLNFIDYDKTGKEVGSHSEETGESVLVNEYEGDIIEKLLFKLEKEGFNITKDIALITPYSQQKKYLLNRFKIIDRKNVDTVDAFQGREAKIVIFSCARNNHPTLFFKKPNRINVAISRAISQIWLIGNKDFCENVSYLKTLINYNKVDQEGCVCYCNHFYYDGLEIKKSQS